ncbi:MAG: acetyl-CoA carboxylase biotin carboxyl carrier protein [Eubacteriales bacterium]|nr:acetyl-CoA carboxylase biotin carboxyl carrier protein [Eubacteriales bacterium]
MNTQDIRELMETMAKTGVTVLDWNNCGGTVHLERKNESSIQTENNENILAETSSLPAESTRTTVVQRSVADSSKTTAKAGDQGEQPSLNEEDKPGEIVKSPVVGIYYSAPSPDSDSFVRQGSKITKGEPLCIIEAMKLMNEVTSPYSGEIAEIMVENGQRVEFGQPLFRIV